ncbi:hypothetical protein [Priestia megaterium]|uniref:hypothetical protein n=1 Tax=Priestia megaterium TaxID=1404 RepID=UPI003EEC5C83
MRHVASKEDIPPEIVKGIATQESGEQLGTFSLWSQISNKEEPKISPDGGIGITRIPPNQTKKGYTEGGMNLK